MCKGSFLWPPYKEAKLKTLCSTPHPLETLFYNPYLCSDTLSLETRSLHTCVIDDPVVYLFLIKILVPRVIYY